MRTFLTTTLAVVILFSSCGIYTKESRRNAAQQAFEKGVRLFDRVEYEAAEKAFERAVSLNPGHEAARRYLGAVRGILGRPQEY